MEYRDVYDNHTPLFHVLTAPLVWIVGDRPELFIWARLAMIPLWALTLVATYLAGRSLYGRRVGLWAAVLAGLLQPMFVKSVEFRTDDLWAMCWMWTIAVLVAGTFTPARGFWSGLLIGLCAGVSIKTGLLATALGWAALASVALPLSPASYSQRARYLSSVASMAVGMTLVPLGIILWFKAHGALQPMLNGTIRFNMEPNTTQRPYRMFGMVPALLTLLWLDSRVKRWAPASPLAGRRSQPSMGFTDGSGAEGTRRKPPQMNSPIDGMATAGSPRSTGLELRKRVPSHRGEEAMRSWRNELTADGIASPRIRH